MEEYRGGDMGAQGRSSSGVVFDGHTGVSKVENAEWRNLRRNNSATV